MPPTTTTPALTRTAQLARLRQRRFDVLVVGGGITGAGIARDAARRGLDVALVERDDFASGTSSRSSRLVHGGVRYLEHGHLRLVFESSHERRVLLRIAPHLVRPLAFTWPVYAGARVPRWKLRAGLLLYDLLALFRNVAPHRGLSAADIAESEPMLERHALMGGARYFDAATDDARLTLATLLAPDGRVMFILPAGQCTLIGTTETETTESPDDVRATRADVEYLLHSANRAFPDAALTIDDVIAAWAGIRPLAAAAHSGDANSASREHLVETGPGGVITVTGGKLTSYRVVARDVVNVVFRALARPAPRVRTDRIPLAGGDVPDLDAELSAARAATGTDDIAAWLVPAYGGAWHQVWARVGGEATLGARLVATLPYIGADVLHAVEAEFACTVADVLVRRTHLAFETRNHGLAVAHPVAALMAPLLGWTDRGVELAVAEYRTTIERLFTIDA